MPQHLSGLSGAWLVTYHMAMKNTRHEVKKWLESYEQQNSARKIFRNSKLQKEQDTVRNYEAKRKGHSFRRLQCLGM